MKATARLSSKAQVTIPRWARDAIGVVPGEDLAISVDEDSIVIRKVTANLDRFFGALEGLYGDPDAYIRELRDEWKDRT